MSPVACSEPSVKPSGDNGVVVVVEEVVVQGGVEPVP